MSGLDSQRNNLEDTDQADVSPPVDNQPSPEDEKGHAGHSRWMMIACCVPMLAIAIAIAAAGGGGGFLVVAVMCTLMMAAMMGAMSHGGDG